ncbi:CRISPR-associated protein Cas5 [Halonatronum saccharophilum]|uniref:CRISPR-associated protein Cas5 n=1 Tax=Halonatronum saccharophilum TaxID=150060 RepID=UPI0004B61B08|nr:CRISPR-associated protein Cas5 [Halonatronum saccharophilum]
MDIKRVLVFNIRGKFAHFKKFYSNKSSLTYRIPPRTVLMGMVASILEYSRDSYYDIFTPDEAKFGVKVIKEGVPHFECMNYLKEDGNYTQVRLELLVPKDDVIEYQVFFTHEDIELMERLEDKIKKDNLGYGLFLGQRQFRANAEFAKVIEKKDITLVKDYEGKIDTLTFKDNIKQLDVDDYARLTVDNMTASFKKVKVGREPKKMVKVCFEEEGNSINGVFNEVLKVEESYISFFTEIVRD